MDAELDEILAKSISKEVPIRYMTYKGMFVPDSYADIADDIENFQIYDDDVWVSSFPKSGTTWTQEMVWNIANDLNFDGAKENLIERFPFVEFQGSTTTGWIFTNQSGIKIPYPKSKSVEFASEKPRPRFLKTHLPFHLLPRQLQTGEKNAKLVYVCRNPKDVCISYYYHYKLLEAYCGTFDDFCKLFLGDKTYYAPFWEHVIEYWKRRDDENILFLKYEDMKTDLPAVIRKTAEFLGKSLTDQQVEDLNVHLSFKSMKDNPALNMGQIAENINESKIYGENFVAEGEFIRKGVSGQWKTEMSKEMIKKFDEWTMEKLKDYKNLQNEFV